MLTITHMNQHTYHIYMYVYIMLQSTHGGNHTWKENTLHFKFIHEAVIVQFDGLLDTGYVIMTAGQKC